MSAVSMISPQEAASLADKNSIKFIDIRTVGEALMEELPGSLFVPFDLVGKVRLQEMGLADKTPVLVCRSGSRAKQAAEALALEMDNVAVLDGGIERWKNEGLATTPGRRVIPLERQVLIGAGAMMLLFTIMGLLLSPLFFGMTLFMAGGMIFAGATGACGMARILVMMPWNKVPMCTAGCAVPDSAGTQ